jgi:transposase, IS30 family
VSNLSGYKHLSLEEREKLFAWYESGLSLRSIAKKLNRNHSTLSREIDKNTKYGKQYVPCHAHRRYLRVTTSQRSKAPLKSLEIYLYVREHLREPFLWSPEIISGRICHDLKGKLTITTECIYQYIYSKKAKKYKLWQNLACARKKRMKKYGRKIRNNGKIPNAVSISKRPLYINRRRQPGHWESDNMEGSRSSKTALSVSRERAIRYTKISKIVNQTSAVKTKTVIDDLNPFPQIMKRTLTLDNGKENYGHEILKSELNIKVYFCHAYSSSEKGTVERAIKDIRRFIPKGTPLSRVSKLDIENIEYWLNNKPMKCLGFMTPHEKMQQLMSKLEST